MTSRGDLAQAIGLQDHELDLLLDEQVKMLDHLLKANEFHEAEALLVEFATKIGNLRYRHAADQAIKLLEATKPG